MIKISGINILGGLLTLTENPIDNRIKFNLDQSLLDLKVIESVGIEPNTNSIFVNACNETILQAISMNYFSDETIRPIKKQLDEIILGFQDEEKRRIINSVVSCINRNVVTIYRYLEALGNNYSHSRDENDKVDDLVNFVLKSEDTEKIFKDQYGKPCAAIRVSQDKHLEILPMTSIKFKRYLTKVNRDNTGYSLGDGLLNTVITTLSSEAEFNSEVIPLHLRVAIGSEVNQCRNDCIYYDMCDSKRRVIEISKDGWKIIDTNYGNSPILFRKYNQQPLVEPDRNYPQDIFDKLLNLTNVKKENHRHLLKVYIISILIPEIDHVILTTYGQKGAAKSFLLELIKKLIDPSKPTLLTLHRNIEQFIQQVNHNYVCYFDNVKYIVYWLSDEICKAVTGAGHTKRQLYTDDEDIIYEHKRCLGINGINVALTEPDALDRGLSIELQEIDEDERKLEEDLWKEFEQIKPQVLAYILDIISKAMQIKQSLKIKRLPRMADFALWGEAISLAIGYPPDSFLEVYTENRNEQNFVAVNENIVGSLILKFIQDLEKRTGFIVDIDIQYEPQELYKELVDFADNNEIRIDGRQFPKEAASLVKKIKTVSPNLKAAYGIIIQIGRCSDNTSVITISKKTKNTNRVSSGSTDVPEVNDTNSIIVEEEKKNETSKRNLGSIDNIVNVGKLNKADDVGSGGEI
jgi:hypothetical protein